MAEEARTGVDESQKPDQRQPGTSPASGLRSRQGLTSINGDLGTGDVGCRVGSQKQRQVSHLRRRCWAVAGQRDGAARKAQCADKPGGLADVGGNPARADRIDPNSLSCHLNGQGLDKGHLGRFAAGVGRRAGVT